MKIVAFAGSNSTKSINRKFLQFVLKNFEEEDTELIDLNDFEMPIFSVDRLENGFPTPAHTFMHLISEADALICSLAEHNRSFSTAFKNILDWIFMMNPRPFQNKPFLLLAVSPKMDGAKEVYRLAQKHFPLLGAKISGSFRLPQYGTTFDSLTGSIRPTLLRGEFEGALSSFKKALRHLAVPAL